MALELREPLNSGLSPCSSLYCVTCLPVFPPLDPTWGRAVSKLSPAAALDQQLQSHKWEDLGSPGQFGCEGWCTAWVGGLGQWQRCCLGRTWAAATCRTNLVAEGVSVLSFGS